MIRRVALSCLATAVGLSLAGAALSADAERVQRLIVKWDEMPAKAVDNARLQAANLTLGTSFKRARFMSGGAEVIHLPRMSVAAAEAIAGDLRRLPGVRYVEADRLFKPLLVPNDPAFSDQWYLYEDSGGLRVPAAWDISTGVSSTVVAVLDSGVRPHAEFSARLLPGYDFISADAPNRFYTANDGDGRDANAEDPGDWIDSADATDECPAAASDWHGTYVTGLIAAAGNNGAGVAGINWGTRILPVRILGRCGGFVSDIVDAVRWAAGIGVPGVPANPHPARIINLSLGGEGECGEPLQDAINDVIAAGVAVVVAAGNEDEPVAEHSPSSCAGVVVVAATTRAGSRSGFSNFGPEVTVSAPGGSEFDGLVSTSNNGVTTPSTDSYAFQGGTSVAGALATGVMSLMLAVRPTLTNLQLAAQLRATARPFPDSSCTTTLCGAGIIDAGRAVAAARDPVAPIVNAGPDRDVEAGAALTLNATVSDDGPVTLRWTQTAGAPVTLEGADSANLRFTANEAGTLNFRLQATDNDGRSSSDAVAVTVTPADNGGGGAIDSLLLLGAVLLGARRRRQSRLR